VMTPEHKPSSEREPLFLAQWYSKMPRQGAIYGPRGYSLHWTITDKDSWPRRSLVLYRHTLWPVFQVWLWRHKDFCPHGYYKPNGAHRNCHLCAEFTQEYFEEMVGL